MAQKHSVVIIGSGLGGLMSGAILSKNGYKVTVLEKNPKIGGCLQSYNRDGAIFETGVHYIGGLDKGQNLYKIFSYLGLLDKIKIERLDLEHFDKFSFGDNPKEYNFSQTYERYIDSLSKDFPNEKTGIINYCNHVRDICSKFSLYNLEQGDFIDKVHLLDANARDTINSFIKDPLLQNILAGNNKLYAGVAEKSPFYIHALIINSYIESSWRVIGGSSQLANSLAEIIKSNGGEVVTKTKVTKIQTSEGIAVKVICSNGNEYIGDQFISNLHPATTVAITQPDGFRKAYINRIESLENTLGAFILNVVFKKDLFPLKNYNVYHHSTPHEVWDAVNYKWEDWPNCFALFNTTSGDNYSKAASIMTYLRYEDLKPWHNTYNTIWEPGDRGSDYIDFKEMCAQKLFNLVEKKYPGFRNTVETYHTITPLTYRDYTGTPQGSLYGILKDHREPLKSFIPVRTRIPNLLLTGQNLNVHGVLGVTLNAITTCGELVGIDKLLKDIRND